MKKHNLNGIAIPACLLIGLGVGILIGQVAALLLIGLGIGFLLMFLFRKK